MKSKIYFSQLFLLLFGIMLHLPAKADSETRNVGAFTKVELAGPFKVLMKQSEKEFVEVNGDKDVLQKIITKVEGGTLKVYHKEKLNTSEKIQITISFKEITALDCSGAISLKTETEMKLKNLDLDLSGASVTDLMLKCNKLDVDISGAGSVTLVGEAQKVALEISGAGNFSATAFESETYEVEISGSGSAKVNAKTALDVAISGTATVAYKGNPKVEKEISGTGSLKKITE